MTSKYKPDPSYERSKIYEDRLDDDQFSDEDDLSDDQDDNSDDLWDDFSGELEGLDDLSDDSLPYINDDVEERLRHLKKHAGHTETQAKLGKEQGPRKVKFIGSKAKTEPTGHDEEQAGPSKAHVAPSKAKTASTENQAEGDVPSAKSKYGVSKSQVLVGRSKSKVDLYEPPKPKEISLDELKKHNKRKDAWMAIRGKVYDVTKFIRNHPGGVEAIMQGVGKDATQLFEKTHTYVDADTMCFGQMVKLVGPLKGYVKLNYGCWPQ